MLCSSNDGAQATDILVQGNVYYLLCASCKKKASEKIERINEEVLYDVDAREPA